MKRISSLRILAITLGLLSLPASVYAQLDYRGGPLNARQHGYQQGYKDGYAAGRVSNLSNREQDQRNQRLKAQGNGYQPSFGSEAEYSQGYREGFDAGSNDVSNGVPSRLDELFRAPDPGYNPDRSRQDLSARDHGYQHGYKDGYEAGRVSNLSNREQDQRNQRLKAQGNGYQPSFGSEAEYSQGYREGFDAGSNDVSNGVPSRLDELFRAPDPGYNPDRSRQDLSARDHGYQHGYKDGYEAGRVSNLSNREQDQRNQRLKAQGNGYQPSFGSEAEYSQGYREGFDAGSNDVSNGVPSRLDELFRAPDPGYNPDRSRQDLSARDHGYQHGYKDGYEAGRVSNLSNRDQDLRNQRLKAQGNGYQPSFGSEAEYSQGYREGFDAGSNDVSNGVRSRLDELFRAPDPGYNPDRSRQDLSARDHGYQHGYKDGYESGRVSNLSNREQDQRNQRLKAQGNGYQPSFGSEAEYSQGYREGFDAGSNDVSNGVRSRLDELFRPPAAGYNPDQSRQDLSARDHGYQHGYKDGYEAGRVSNLSNRDQDLRNQRLKAQGNGYQPAFGSEAEYSAGYRQGFDAGSNDVSNGVRSRLDELFRAPAPPSNPDRSRQGLSARDHGYQHGYKDGYESGRVSNLSNREQDLRNQRLKAQGNGYQPSFGSEAEHSAGYRQ